MMNFANHQIQNVLILYGIVVLIPYLIFCKLKPDFLSAWKIDLNNTKNEKSHEILSTVSSLFVLYGILLLSGYLNSKNILSWRDDLPTWYHIISFPLVVLLHDAYFYWTHLLMHKSKFLFRFHKNHHTSHEATPLDVYAFHPIEAFVHFIFFLIYPLLIPTSLSIMQFMFVWMLVCNSAGHLSYEFYPRFLYDFPVIRQFNAATHHLMHHKYYNSNFGLYYNWWDRWMGTNHRDYFNTYRKVTNKKKLLQMIKMNVN